MAENNVQKKKTEKNPLIGSQIKPTTLNTTTNIDIDVSKKLIDDIIEGSLSDRIDGSAISSFTTISNSRDIMYQQIDTMMQDSGVAVIVRTLAEDATAIGDNGHVVWAESDDVDVSRFVNYLLNVVNVDKYSYGWVYSLITYGDLYLRLFRDSDYEDKLFSKDRIAKAYSARNVLNEDYINEQKEELEESVRIKLRSASDRYSFYAEAVADPSTMFELTKYGKTFGYVETPNSDYGYNYGTTTNYNGIGNSQQLANFKMKSSDINIYQADDFVHAYLFDGQSRFPETVKIFTEDIDYESDTYTEANGLNYNVRRGKSMLYDAYKIWREKSLLESAILLTRVTRSSLIQKVTVEVGDMGKEQAAATLRKVKALFEQKSSLNPDASMSEYTNPGAIVNYVYLTSHEGKGNVSVESIGGDVNIKDLADLDNWVNKFYASFGIPKQYFGYTDDGAGFNGGSALSITSSVYSKSVIKVQNAYLQMLSDMISLFLIDRGYKSYINKFVLRMKAPVTLEEKDYRDSLTNQISAISNLISLFGDVEDKGRKLRLVKTFVSTLNFGDEMLNIIQEEIDEAEKQKKEAEEQAKLEAENGGATGEASGGSTDLESSDLELEEPAETSGGDEDMDLGMSSVAVENFMNNGGETHLVENILDDVVEEALLEDEELPTPEELNASKDFTRNE